jgi:hypothetical protein
MPRRAKINPADILTDESLWCRTLRHKWEWERDLIDGTTFDRVIVCERCGLTKVQTISTRTWVVLKTRSGKYPEGYLSNRGRVAMTDVRRAQFERAMLAKQMQDA